MLIPECNVLASETEGLKLFLKRIGKRNYRISARNWRAKQLFKNNYPQVYIDLYTKKEVGFKKIISLTENKIRKKGGINPTKWSYTE